MHSGSVYGSGIASVIVIFRFLFVFLDVLALLYCTIVSLSIIMSFLLLYDVHLSHLKTINYLLT